VPVEPGTHPTVSLQRKELADVAEVTWLRHIITSPPGPEQGPLEWGLDSVPPTALYSNSASCSTQHFSSSPCSCLITVIFILKCSYLFLLEIVGASYSIYILCAPEYPVSQPPDPYLAVSTSRETEYIRKVRCDHHLKFSRQHCNARGYAGSFHMDAMSRTQHKIVLHS
jgi:hypothetical protein